MTVSINNGNNNDHSVGLVAVSSWQGWFQHSPQKDERTTRGRRSLEPVPPVFNLYLEFAQRLPWIFQEWPYSTGGQTRRQNYASGRIQSQLLSTCGPATNHQRQQYYSPGHVVRRLCNGSWSNSYQLRNQCQSESGSHFCQFHQHPGWKIGSRSTFARQYILFLQFQTCTNRSQCRWPGR